MTSETTTIYLNGEWQEAHAGNVRYYQPSLHAGSGVMELMRAYTTESGPHIVQAAAHFDRLRQSAQHTHLDLPYSTEELTQLAELLLQKNNLNNAFVRAMVYLEGAEDDTDNPDANVLLTAWNAGSPTQYHSLRVMTSNYHLPADHNLVASKEIGHQTNTMVAAHEARKHGFDNALLLNHKGYVVGGPSATFFFELNDTLYTAPKDQSAPSITRQLVIELAKEIGYQVVETNFKPEEARGADAAFFASTSREIQGIGSLDKIVFTKDWEDSMGFNLLLRYRKAAQEQTMPLGII